MQLDHNDLKQIAVNLDKSFPGFSEAFDKDTTKIEPGRATLLEYLQAAAAIGTLVVAFKAMAPVVNNLLRDIEPGKTPDEIISALSKAFHEQIVVPSQENGARVRLVINAILAHIKSRLGG
jgi:Na+-transporting methylmalonyl-CoA/oxaloacetate decarboxylase gamma subunit